MRPGIRGPWSAPAERHRLASRCAPCKGGNRASSTYRKLNKPRHHDLVIEPKPGRQPSSAACRSSLSERLPCTQGCEWTGRAARSDRGPWCGRGSERAAVPSDMVPGRPSPRLAKVHPAAREGASSARRFREKPTCLHGFGATWSTHDWKLDRARPAVFAFRCQQTMGAVRYSRRPPASAARPALPSKRRA